MSNGTFDRTALGNEAERLLEALLRHVDESGRVQMSTAVLQQESGLTQSGLTRARNQLSGHDLLNTQTGFKTDGRRGANIYTLRMAVLKPIPEPSSDAESGQNYTEDPGLSLVPATSQVPSGSDGTNVQRGGFLARLFRRSRAS